MNLAGKRCLVTGGSRGLGRAIALALAGAGARVAFTYRQRDEDAEQTRAMIAASGEEPLVLRGDAADKAHADAAVAACVGAWGGLDALVNNAGTTQIMPLALLTEADWDACMAVHAKGAFLFSQAALRPMIRQRGGHIVNIGSFAAERVVEAPVHYAAAKGAVRSFTLALAREVGRYGVRVSLVVPGMLSAGLSARLPPHRVAAFTEQSALGRLGSPEEVAAAVAWLVSGGGDLLTGAAVVLDGGL